MPQTHASESAPAPTAAADTAGITGEDIEMLRLIADSIRTDDTDQQDADWLLEFADRLRQRNGAGDDQAAPCGEPTKRG